MLALGVSGAVTALGDTLFPAGSLAQGLSQDFSPTAHLFVRLRLLHPVIAISVSIYLMLVAVVTNSSRSGGFTGVLSPILIVLLFLQLAAGALNVALLAPVWLQLAHLFVADTIWVVLVLLTASALAQEAPSVDMASLPQA
jgi:heme A synthase